jgi:hypothetical protein
MTAINEVCDRYRLLDRRKNSDGIPPELRRHIHRMTCFCDRNPSRLITSEFMYVRPVHFFEHEGQEKPTSVIYLVGTPEMLQKVRVGEVTTNELGVRMVHIETGDVFKDTYREYDVPVNFSDAKKVGFNVSFFDETFKPTRIGGILRHELGLQCLFVGMTATHVGMASELVTNSVKGFAVVHWTNDFVIG